MKCETGVLQNIAELAAFSDLLGRENVRSYLEVGSKFGGSFWYICNRLPTGSRVVSVDLPHGDTSFKESQPALEECVAQLKARGYDAHLILGDSTDKDIVAKVYELGPFDATFIDGNHTMPYITKDWENYSKITKLIAFHDIGWWRPPGHPSRKKSKAIEAPEFWEKIKKGYKNFEIKYDRAPQPAKRNNGIGVLWV